MVPLNDWLLFAAAALFVAITPGPNMVYLLSRSLCQGKRAGVISLMGVVVGFLAHMFAAAVGLRILERVRPASSRHPYSPFPPVTGTIAPET